MARRKSWLATHWDEVILIGGILGAIFFILRGSGYF